jgi:hypothetical protein
MLILVLQGTNRAEKYASRGVPMTFHVYPKVLFRLIPHSRLNSQTCKLLKQDNASQRSTLSSSLLSLASREFVRSHTLSKCPHHHHLESAKIFQPGFLVFPRLSFVLY